MDNRDRAMAEAAGLLQSMGKPKFETFEQGLAHNGEVRCACKKKIMPISDIRPVKSKFLDGTDSTCKECLKLIQGMCPVMCASCREVVAYLEPGKDPDGFKRLADEVYHIEDCAQCNPDKFEGKEVETILVEKKAYMRVCRNMNL